MTATSPETAQSTAKSNTFESSVSIGFPKLSSSDAKRVVVAMRQASPSEREVFFSAGSTKGIDLMTPEERAAHDRRTQKVRNFFEAFLPSGVATMLAEKIGPKVTGFAVIHTSNDERYTLYVERNPF